MINLKEVCLLKKFVTGLRSFGASTTNGSSQEPNKPGSRCKMAVVQLRGWGDSPVAVAVGQYTNSTATPSLEGQRFEGRPQTGFGQETGRFVRVILTTSGSTTGVLNEAVRFVGETR